MEKFLLFAMLILMFTACDPTPHHKVDNTKIDSLIPV